MQQAAKLNDVPYEEITEKEDEPVVDKPLPPPKPEKHHSNSHRPHSGGGHLSEKYSPIMKECMAKSPMWIIQRDTESTTATWRRESQTVNTWPKTNITSHLPIF